MIDDGRTFENFPIYKRIKRDMIDRGIASMLAAESLTFVNLGELFLRSQCKTAEETKRLEKMTEIELRSIVFDETSAIPTNSHTSKRQSYQDLTPTKLTYSQEAPEAPENYQPQSPDYSNPVLQSAFDETSASSVDNSETRTRVTQKVTQHQYLPPAIGPVCGPTIEPNCEPKILQIRNQQQSQEIDDLPCIEQSEEILDDFEISTSPDSNTITNHGTPSQSDAYEMSPPPILHDFTTQENASPQVDEYFGHSDNSYTPNNHYDDQIKKRVGSYECDGNKRPDDSYVIVFNI